MAISDDNVDFIGDGKSMDFTGERYIPGADLNSEIEIEHFQRYQSIRPLIKGKTVVDAASGAGYGTAILSEEAFFACGIEISQEAVRYSSEKYAFDNLRYIQGSVDCLPLQSEYADVFVSFETIEHVNEKLQRNFLEEIKRVLKPGGLLVISTPDKYIYSDKTGNKNEYHLKEFYREEYYDFLLTYFKNVKFYDQFSVLSYFLVGERGCLEVLDSERGYPYGKYIVAICSDGKIPVADGGGLVENIVVDTDDKHQKKIDRILELQGEIEDKNKSIFWMEDCVEDEKIKVAACEEKIRELAEDVEGKTTKLLNLTDNIRSLQQEKSSMQKTIDGERQKFNDINCQLDKLKLQLQHIYSTKAWKIVQKLYLFKSKL